MEETFCTGRVAVTEISQGPIGGIPEPSGTVDTLPTRHWTIRALLGYALKLVLLTIPLAIAVALMLRLSGIGGPLLPDPRPGQPISDLDLLSLPFLSAAQLLASWPLVFKWTRRHERDPRGFLGLRSADRSEVAKCVGLTLAVAIGFTALLEVFGFVETGDEIYVRYFAAKRFEIALALGIIVLAPAVEEFLFRGFLLRGLQAVGASTWTSAILSAAGWSVLHFTYSWSSIAVIFLVGLVLAMFRLRTGSLVPSLAGHMALNAVAVADLMNRVG